MRAKSDALVAEAARAWGRMRLLALAVKEARNSCRCEHEEDSDYVEGGGVVPGVPPCWKRLEWTYDHEPADPDEWCGPCLARHQWHLALVAIKRLHGGRLRRLQRFASVPAETRIECPTCEGDGFGPLGSNCQRCGGGGKVAS